MGLEAVQLVSTARRSVTATRGAAFAAVLVGFAPVIGLAGAQGGFFPSAWGWASLPLLWVTAVALVMGEDVRLSKSELIFIGLLCALTAWILISSIWSVAPAASILESQRALVYLAGATAVLVVARERYLGELLGGLLAAVSLVAAFSLSTRLLPDRVGVYDRTSVYRLAQPIGYWNGLAIFAGLGVLLAFGFSARATSMLVRAASAAALVILLPTLYFTFGRGAWIALASGLVMAIVVDPRRLQLLATVFVLAPAPALAVLVASNRPGLTHSGVSLAAAEHDGHQVAALIIALAAVNVTAAVALAYAERRVDPGTAVRQVFAGAVAVLLVSALAIVFARYGGPVTLVEKGYAAFTAPPPHAVVDLNRRLLSFSGNGRAELWRLAWDDTRENPALGAGAGTYERYFLERQPAEVSRVRDAHGLYVETLAELGPVGLALLIAALFIPLTVLPGARGHPLVPAAAGAYVAYVVHTGVDWDWELPAVTLAGILCGAALLIAARHRLKPPQLSAGLRWSGVGLAVVLSIAVGIGLAGNMALSRSDHARRAGDWARAATDARTARVLMPWSPAPWEALGRAQLGAGLLGDARASFRKAISMDRGDWELWYRLASASSGQTRLSALREATRLFPRARFLHRPPAQSGTRP